MKKRLIVGIPGRPARSTASRSSSAEVRPDWESHVILSDAGALNLWHELGIKRRDLEKLADVAYHPKDIGATIASGSYLTEGMVIAPCSMKTLAAWRTRTPTT
jgi:3-polyprenyl-4-hydroxybenzoate decarboxylase